MDSMKPASTALALGEELTRQIRDFTAGQRVTESTFLQMAWALVLQRYKGTPDVVYGNVISGRVGGLPGDRARDRAVHQHRAGALPGHGPDAVSGGAGPAAKGGPGVRGDGDIAAERTAGRRGEAALIDHLFIFENYPVERSGEAVEEGAGTCG